MSKDSKDPTGIPGYIEQGPPYFGKPITYTVTYGNNDPMVGRGGAPTRASTLSTDGTERKKYPVGTGVLDYFPDALIAIAKVSYVGNEQHNPGQPLHWARGKSADEADTMIRHYMQRGTIDIDGQRHSAKMCWRSLAILQKEIEADQKASQDKQHARAAGAKLAQEIVNEMKRDDVN